MRFHRNAKLGLAGRRELVLAIAAMTLGTISARLAAATPYANQRPNPMSRTRKYEIETPRELCWSTIQRT
jgi:hypothetical protein